MRWSPNGEQLVSASDDKTAKIVDFTTSKVISTLKTSDKGNIKFFVVSNLFSFCEIQIK